MKFNSQICTTREQSERLIALGLNKETADCGIYYSELAGCDRMFAKIETEFEADEIPAWSLHRLLEMNLNSTDTRFKVRFNQLDVKYAYELLFARIEWLIKEGHFNKEYLEEQK